MASKQYSFEEVKKHNNNQSTWVVIHNSIYDVTAFLNEHPGGEEVLLEQAGKEASEAFEDVGHSTDARELMSKYLIGEILESERKPTAPKKPQWHDDSDKSKSESSVRSWLLPVILGVVATLIYRFYFQ